MIVPWKLGNDEKVLGPWLEGEEDPSKRSAVLDALGYILAEADFILSWPALFHHPLQRSYDVPEANVTIDFLLAKQFHIVQLIRIAPIID